tara:strand:+ start:706 stop:939 length:234 start_codon:yes stop_codon:yes gene_type:complete
MDEALGCHVGAGGVAAAGAGGIRVGAGILGAGADAMVWVGAGGFAAGGLGAEGGVNCALISRAAGAGGKSAAAISSL